MQDYGSPEIAALEAIVLSMKRKSRMREETTKNGPPALHQIAKKMYKDRRRRDTIFTGALSGSGEPWWDMMLDLYVAFAAGADVSVSSAAIASGASPTTAIRWITMLETDDVISRREDPNDRRRSFLDMTEKGLVMMQRYLLLAA